MQYKFEWDPKKAQSNRFKHGVSFEQATTVFLDPLSISIYDKEHSIEEDRWITLGISTTGGLLVINHTFVDVDDETVFIRIISTRKAKKREQQQYTE